MVEAPELDESRIWIQLLDNAYIAWRAAESECGRLLRKWFAASAHRAPVVYLTYRAALDREEASARALQRLCESPDSERDELIRRAVSGHRG